MSRIPLMIFSLLAIAGLAPLPGQHGASTRPTPPPVKRIATVDMTVARLMSFDRNHDGVLAESELPERMRGVLARYQGAKAGVLNAVSIRRLAQHPVEAPAVNGIQPGHYGFGDETDLDTRLHLNDAIDDLRLAAATRDEARGIATRFMDRHDKYETTALLATLRPLLTPGQLTRVTALLGRPMPLTGTMTFKQLSSEPGRQNTMVVASRMMRQNELARLVRSFEMSRDHHRRADAAVARFNRRDRLSDADRRALLSEMRSVLSTQERDDLRAALERRPVVKQTLVAAVAPPRPVFKGDTLVQPPVALHGFGIQDLVLH
jgi:hypothetical protein